MSDYKLKRIVEMQTGGWLLEAKARLWTSSLWSVIAWPMRANQQATNSQLRTEMDKEI